MAILKITLCAAAAATAGFTALYDGRTATDAVPQIQAEARSEAPHMQVHPDRGIGPSSVDINRLADARWN
ncbi:hypothetical protein [Massilia putida]|uniref:hypothetical protein n=1 Tax=Massilia putida TaxID=1141883 RepID=UPI0009525423|nr:hypothetical protein [Massilia putida]